MNINYNETIAGLLEISNYFMSKYSEACTYILAENSTIKQQFRRWIKAVDAAVLLLSKPPEEDDA